MHTRIVSGVLGAIFVFVVLAFNTQFPLLVNIILSIISVFSVSELLNVMGIHNIRSVAIPSLFVAGIIPLINSNIIYQICFYVYTVLVFFMVIIDKFLKLKDISLLYMMMLVITFSISRLVVLRDMGGVYGSFYVLLTLSIAWFSDTGAYFFGKYFGKNKLCPKISPKKTLEGFFGGIVVCIFSVILIGFIFNNFIFTDKQRINYFLLFVMGLFGSPIATLGDLYFSIVKRSCHVKDFGNVIPGHGGILDRFDSVIFVSPYAYFFLYFVSVIV